jgi:maltose phosphorylase
VNKYLKLDPWCIIEDGFNPQNNRASESLFSLGNTYMGQRANFEEQYSGDTLLGNYIAGVYYPDLTKVGWWKIGYPDNYAKLVNITNWIGIDIKIDNETLDLANCKISKFKRILNMQKGYLTRSFIAKLNNKQVKVDSQRFLSMADKEIAAIKYSITPLNFSGYITCTPYLDSDVKNENTNYNEKFLITLNSKTRQGEAYITTETRKSNIRVCTGMRFDITQNGKPIKFIPEITNKKKYAANKIKLKCKTNETITIYKYVANITSRDYKQDQLFNICKKVLLKTFTKKYDLLFKEHQAVWAKKWQQNDIIIEGDIAAQQGIRFNIFQLNQTYSGDDPRINITPKGFTGEKYGATTQWDSETFCLPYYLSTTNPKITKSLLLYRYNHLKKAIQNAKNLGFINGAALYPMATVNGDECQNEWEITFEEIHRNGAIAYAIYNYVRYTDDKSYLIDYGLEVLIALSRFWSQRVNFSQLKNKYVILGVTGPNEYENNVNNNWYTNNIACWTIEYTLEIINYVKQISPQKYAELSKKLNFNEQQETHKWQDILKNMYFPTNKKLGIFLQQEGYLDKQQMLAKDLDQTQRPLNQHWSWDRILRSSFIKQADILQGIFFFADKYDIKTIKKNFDFYEPRTVHESSLSPCIHATIAAWLGYQNKAYELFLAATRLDLDDYNNEVKEGCHTTSMAGSWIALVYGFAGMRIKKNILHFSPIIIPKWRFYSFKILFRGNLLAIKITKNKFEINNISDKPITLVISNKQYTIAKKSSKIIARLYK